MLDHDKLQRKLRNLDSVDVIDLAKIMDMGVDDLLLGIKEVIEEYSTWFKRTAWKLPLLKGEEARNYFSIQIVDLGFLCQHIIKDFKKSVKKKHARLVYVAYKKKWLIHRGY